MTPENAWRTLRRTTTAGLLPGDSVLLQRGDSWRESLTIRDSGDSLRRIKFASYGTGARPRLFGSSDGTGVSNWQSAGDSLWYCENIAQPPGMLFVNRSAMRERSSLADLAESSTWYYEASSGRVYVKLRVNPGSFEMEIAERDGIVVQGVSNIEVRDLDIQYASNGVTMQGAHDVLIENVTIHDMAYSGIFADGASTNNTVVHCAFTDWNWGISRARTAEGVAEPGAGIFLRGGENAPSVNWIIEKNSFTLSDATGRSETAAIRVSERGHALLIADNRIKGYAGVALSGVVITKPLGEQPMLIRGNEVTNCAGGAIRIEDLAAYGFSAGITLERNRVIDSAAQDETEQAVITLRTGGSFPVSLRYNTVAGTLKGEHDHDALSVRASSGVTIFHNVFYGADCGVSLKEGSEAVALNNIASGNRKCAIWRDAESTLNERHNDLDGPAIGFEPSTTSFSAEPIFAGAGKGDFQLGAGSPCRDRGEKIAGIDQETIGMAPDVGAEEYRSGTELATEPEKVTSAGLSIRAAAATTNTATIQVKYLSDLTWTSMTNGWGPAEKDKSNGEQSTGDGKTITLNGTTYAKGLGIHAPSTIKYSLAGTCTAFTAAAGMDDESGSNGSVIFQVWADGTKLYDSGTMTGVTATKPVAVNLTNRSELSLVVTDAGNGNSYDHADWADAQLTCVVPGTIPPPTSPPTPASAETYLSDLTWTSMTNGWGSVEKDKSNGEQSTGDGNTITLNGTTYAKGLGVHAGSTITYSLGGKCTAFNAAIGMDDEVGANGSVVFQVWADGTKLYDSGTMTGATATKPVAADLTGRSLLLLV
jgi:NPCBM/NEW2 domain/Right handed beta helix region